MHELQNPDALAGLLLAHPEITTAYITHRHQRSLIIAELANYSPQAAKDLPSERAGLTIEYQQGHPLNILRLPLPAVYAETDHTRCQDEPIKLGTQIQPAGAQWLGTAGAPCRWRNKDGKICYGILSNAHVMVVKLGAAQTPQHQPTTAKPACAHLTDYIYPRPNIYNYCDAAIADALIDGYHTISAQIVGIGPLPPTWANAQVGTKASKAGRTTGVTTGECTAVGAAVRVGYGSYTAVFADQDIFEATGGIFSAAGDSGSLIVRLDDRAPLSLLFAGGGNITVGSPIRHVVDALGIDFTIP